MYLIKAAINMLYPRRCPVCDEIVVPYGAKICFACRKKLHYIEEPRCAKCGKHLTEEQEYCFDCQEKEHVYTKGLALYEYECVRSSLYRYKYDGRREYAEFYGEEIVRYLGHQIREWNAQALIPVPLHRKKQQKRGYNQAQLMAAVIGRHLGIPVRNDLILREKNTVPQKKLDNTERQNNLKKAFKLVPNDVKLETIIIIDDIYTTGSTIDAMSKELKKMGISQIYFISLAIGSGL